MFSTKDEVLRQRPVTLYVAQRINNVDKKKDPKFTLNECHVKPLVGQLSTDRVDLSTYLDPEAHTICLPPEKGVVFNNKGTPVICLYTRLTVVLVPNGSTDFC